LQQVFACPVGKHVFLERSDKIGQRGADSGGYAGYGGGYHNNNKRCEHCVLNHFQAVIIAPEIRYKVFGGFHNDLL